MRTQLWCWTAWFDVARYLDMKAAAVIGQELELTVLNEFLTSQERLPAGLVFVGEAGIGKTTLWRHGLAAAAAAGYQIMATQATASEFELGFAVLAALLQESAAELLPELPLLQRRALEVAVLLAEPGPDPPQPRAISVALLAVLRLAARDRPLLIAVDDDQWIDTASSAVLEFAIRRLRGEPIGFLFTRRSDRDDEPPVGIERAFSPERLTRMRVGPLSLSALHELLRSRLTATFAPPTLRRLADTSAGNPFFALELARAVISHRGALEIDEPLPLPRTLTTVLANRLQNLPQATLDALLVASLGSNPSVALIARTLPGDGWQRLRPAVEADVVQLDGERIHFVHPLLASVAQASADLGRRREAHRRLADVALDPEERALHLSLAAERPSEAVASVLEHAANRARSRGASDTAAVLSERAARLTPVRHLEDARRRTLLAVDSHLDAGALDRAEHLLERLVGASPPGTLRAGALRRLASIHIQRHGPAATIHAAETALAEAVDDLRITAAIEQTLAWAHHNDGNLRAARFHAQRAVALGERVGDSRHLASALATFAFMEFVAGKGLDVQLIERAVSLESEEHVIITTPRWIHGMLLEWSGELRRAETLLAKLQAENIGRGQDVQVPFARIHLARLSLQLGDWALAKRIATEALEQTLQMSLGDEQAYALATAARVDAHWGHVESARELARQGLALVARTGSEPARFEFLAVLGFLELSLGDAAAAHEVLASLAAAASAAGFEEPAILRFDSDYVEALIGLGRLEEATSVVERLETHTRAVTNTWTRMAATRCRGLLEAARGDSPGALATLEAAHLAAAELGEPFELARTQLALAIVQRRSKRWADARRSLMEALGTFERLGANLWATRARDELTRVPGRKPAGRTLTPTELRVAELVAEGRSNKEVATALFVSVKAVEANLSRVYEKLAVRSRSELAHKFAREREP
jgi:DNA-binding CsgD family transcriptional regulator